MFGMDVHLGHQVSSVSLCDQGTGIHELPFALLAKVLQRLSQRDRFRSCALVDRKWRQAAKLATSRVQYAADLGQNWPADNLSAWLCSNEYFNTIQGIRVDDTRFEYQISSCDAKQALYLPIARLGQLQELTLARCEVIPAIRKAHPAATALELASSAVSASPADASAAPELLSIAALKALSRLELVDISYTCIYLYELGWAQLLYRSAASLNNSGHFEDDLQPGDESDRCYCRARDTVAGVVTALPQLTQLTHVDLEYYYVQKAKHLDRNITAWLSSTQHLQSLRLLLGDNVQMYLEQLPTSLRTLVIDTFSIGFGRITRMTVTGLPGLTQLQHLQLLNAAESLMLQCYLAYFSSRL